MKVLIIEDEPFAQKELARLLKETGREIRVLDMIDSVEDSISWLQSNPEPELIFLDIQLADGLSFEIFNQVKIQAPVIFTTAFDEYAIEAFKLNSIDYLLKPIKPDDLGKALSKLDSFKEQFKSGAYISEEQVQQLLRITKKEYKQRYMIKTGDTVKSIQTSDVAYFYAEENVVFLKKSSGERFIIDHTMEKVEKEIDPDEFFRISRGYIIHIDAIKKVSKYFNNRLSLELEPAADDTVIISRLKVAAFLQWLDR
jgi:DNA-binding LytR/AlgR family response regulator